jgi:hypothetical protein
MKYDTMFQRLVANSEIPEDQNENGCWNWTGTRDRRKEYGMLNVRVEGKVKHLKPHRVMYEITRGVTLTEDQTVEHLCESGLCLNPDHLDDELLSHSENARRSILRKPRGVWNGR